MDQNDAQLEQGGTPENNQTTENHNMESLLAESMDIVMPTSGEIRPGVIASLSQNQILVSVGTKSEGVISGKELEAIPPQELATFQVGMEIPVYVVNPEDQGGNLVLSYVKAREENSWKDAETMQTSGETFSGQIVGYNKGGLIVPLGTLRGFVPASQISLSRRVNLQGDTPEQRWSKMIGQDISVRVIEVDRERRRLILSERAASTETRESLKERVIEELKEGEIRTGRVTSLADFGAFVNISGADGLVHLSEISWDRIQHPSEVLKVGQEVKVKVISIDRDKKRIGLSIRQLLEDPWAQRVANFVVGQLVQGTITRLTKFGAFARLEGNEDIEGLIHISEISEKRIEHPKEVLHENDVVTLRVIKIDADNHRIGLSLRRVDSPMYADMDWQSLADQLDTPEKEIVPAEDNVEETPAEQPAEEPKEEPTEQPAAERKEEPTEQSVKEPKEKPTERLVKEPKEKPTERLVKEPKEKPIEQPESSEPEE